MGLTLLDEKQLELSELFIELDIEFHHIYAVQTMQNIMNIDIIP